MFRQDQQVTGLDLDKNHALTEKGIGVQAGTHRQPASVPEPLDLGLNRVNRVNFV
jgi:hypothetical protein